MVRYLRRIAISIISSLTLAMSASAQGGAGALKGGLDAAAGAADLPNRGGTLPGLAGVVIGSVLSLMAVLFFALTIYGGFLWMTARGNTEQIEKGKKTIIAATIGIIIVIGSYAVTNFVLRSTSSGANETPAGVTTSDRCRTELPGGSCRNIDTCPSILEIRRDTGITDLETERRACEGNPDCRVNLCPGGNEIVCCR